MSSSFSGRVKLSVFGQSHSAGIGIVIDDLPSGEAIDLEELQSFLNRRAPGGNDWSTPRREADQPEILSGLVNGYTCGAPLCAVIHNTNTRSGDYKNIMDTPRPGHADYTAQVKYGGYQDVSGGGHFSGRLTAPICIAGGILMQILKRRGITIGAHLKSIAGVNDDSFDPVTITAEELTAPGKKLFPVINNDAGTAMMAAIANAKQDLDSVGGIIECAAVGVPAGIGDPMFDGMENRISRCVFAVPAVKGIEFGAGFEVASLRGSVNNDPFYMDGDAVRTRTNNCGGILGGITNGMPIIFRAAMKPTPSIARTQDSISLSNKVDTQLDIHGRHDPCVAPRAVPCIESALAIAIADALL